MPARTKKKTPRKAATNRAKAARPAKNSTSPERSAKGPKRAKSKSGSKPAAKPRSLSRKPKAPQRKSTTKVAKKPARPAKKAAKKTTQPKSPVGKKTAASKAASASPSKERLAKQREKERLAKQREQERLAKQREQERLAKQREQERLAKQREKERLAKQREQARLAKQREKERLAKQREKERLAKQREKERQRIAAEKEKERARAAAARETERREREEERERERREREEERERVREEARRLKEEERAKRDAEREAYRKAKEAERERLRREREAARRALEGKVLRLTKRAQRAAGVGRNSTTRVYRPDAIPNQSGTSLRRDTDFSKFANLHPPAPVVVNLDALEPEPEPPPPPPPPPPERIEERYALIQSRLAECSQEFRRAYSESFDMSWIYHDSALEGVVYTYQELKTAIDPNVTVVPDSSMQPVCEEIRRHKAALDLVRDLGEKKRSPITVDLIKKIFLVLHPEEGDLKSVKYRKDIPQHRLYFHEYAPPDKIAYRVRQVIDWLNGPEPKKIKDPIRVASRVQYDLVRVFPFAQDSGKVARLLMNIILMRSGYPPAIMHSTERQRYYEALKGTLPVIVSMVREAINNGLASIEKRLDDRDSNRGF